MARIGVRVWQSLIVGLFVWGGQPSQALAATHTKSDWSTFQGNNQHSADFKVPSLKKPHIRWQRHIGLQTWLNNPLIVGQQVFVSNNYTAYRADYFSDDEPAPSPVSGVSALDLSTGETLWRWEPDDQEPRSLSYAKDLVLVSSADCLIALDASTGREQWKYTLSKTHQWGNHFQGNLVIGDLVISGSSSGQLLALELESGQVRWQRQFYGGIRNALTQVGQNLIVGTEAGELLALEAATGQTRWSRALTTPYPDWSDRSDRYPVQLYAAPSLCDGRLIVSYVRRHAFNDPALIALDPQTGQTLWQASDPKQLKTYHGNLRASVACRGQEIFVPDPVGGALVAFNSHKGQVEWVQQPANDMQRHWPSPLLSQDLLYLPRHDGGLYAYDLTGHLRWQFYLGDPSLAGPQIPSGIEPGHLGLPSIGDAIYATPALADDGTLIVGGGSGWLYALEETTEGQQP